MIYQIIIDGKVFNCLDNYKNWDDDGFPENDLLIRSNYIAKADISNCYPSIYSHSISWALVGKIEAKLKSEKILTTSNINYTILRTILVYGQVFDMTRSNIVLWVKKSLENKEQITIVNDQYRMPTYVEDLALACKLSIDNKATGVFNISSNTLLSIFEIAKQIAEVFNLDENLIKPISTAELNQKAIRPVKTGFDLTKTNKVLNFFPESFKEDLQKFKEKLTLKSTFND